MLFRRNQSKRFEKRGRGRLFLIVASQYAILFLSGLASAAAIYLVFGSINPFFITSNVAILAAAGISMTYLMLHQCGAWKYSRDRMQLPLRKKSGLLAWTRIINVLAIPVWVAAGVLGLMIASNSPLCSRNPATTSYWGNWSLNNCKIQKAAIATTLTAMVISMILFCTLATAKHPFAASLAGVHLQDHDEEESLSLSAASWPSPRMPDRDATRPSFDTSIYSPSFQTSAPQQDKWLPKLNFETPTDQRHPTRRTSLNDIHLLRHKESNLLPSPTILHTPPGTFTRGRPRLKRNNGTETIASSIYSRSTAESTFSKHASTMSSFSDDSSICSPIGSPPPTARIPSSKPSVPAIPEQYRPSNSSLPVTSLRNGGQPMRPRSRPPMPPPKFWEYAMNEQQSYQPFMNEIGPPAIPIAEPFARTRRHTEYSHNRAASDTSSIRPCTPLKIAALMPNMNSSNMMQTGRVEKRSYERLRKGRSMDIRVDDSWILRPQVGDGGLEVTSKSFENHGGYKVERRQSRTLVKKRQPWDKAPRISCGDLRKL